MYFFFGFSILFSQDTVGYFNQEWEACSRDSASYYRVVIEDKNIDTLYHVKDFYMSGQLQMESTYAGLVPTINWKLTNHQGLHLEAVKHGKCTWYYENGRKKEEINYDLGKKQGNARGWYMNGQLQYEESYKKDTLNGDVMSYYDNGFPAQKGNFLEGERYGLWKYFGDSGNVDSERYFTPGFQCNSVTQDSMLTIIPGWNLGDSYQVQVNVFQSFGKDEKKDNVLSSNHTISVVDSNEQYYIIDWICNDLMVGISNDLPDVLFKEIMNKKLEEIGELKYKLKISKRGKFKELLNWPEIQLVFYHLADSLESSLIHLEEYNFSSDEIEEIKNRFITRINTKDEIISHALDITGILLGAYNQVLHLKEKQVRGVYIPSGEKGSYYPATLETHVENLDVENKTCTVIYNTVRHEELTADEIQNQDQDNFTRNKNYAGMERADYLINYKTSWPIKVSYVAEKIKNGDIFYQKVEYHFIEIK